MEVYHIWIIIGILLIIAEVFSMDFVVSCFGIAALATSIGAYAEISFNWQLVMFSLVSLFVFIAIRPAIRHKLLQDKIKTGSDAMVGTEHIVTEGIDNDGDTGYVKVGSEFWRARSHQNEIIEKGSKIRIESVVGSTVRVSKIQDKEE